MEEKQTYTTELRYDATEADGETRPVIAVLLLRDGIPVAAMRHVEHEQKTELGS